MTHYRVIFHINEKGKGNTVISEVKNLRVDLGESLVTIEVLANSDGVLEFVKGVPLEGDIRALADKGVVFALCAYSMASRGLSPGQLFIRQVRIVASGVGELVRRQNDGYLYLKV
jgi:uncharacterized protein